MVYNDLKDKIVNKIQSLENEALLKEIYQILHLESEADQVYYLTAEQRHAVSEGIEDYKKGKLYSSSQANDIIEEWRKK